MKYRKGKLGKEFEESLKLEKGKGWIIGNFSRFKIGDPRRTNALEVKYWKIKEGEKIDHPPKMQKSATEVTIILKGEMTGTIDGDKVTVSEGEYVVINPKTVSNMVEKYQPGTEVLTIKAPSDPDDTVRL